MAGLRAALAACATVGQMNSFVSQNQKVLCLALAAAPEAGFPARHPASTAAAAAAKRPAAGAKKRRRQRRDDDDGVSEVEDSQDPLCHRRRRVSAAPVSEVQRMDDAVAPVLAFVDAHGFAEDRELLVRVATDTYRAKLNDAAQFATNINLLEMMVTNITSANMPEAMKPAIIHTFLTQAVQ